MCPRILTGSWPSCSRIFRLGSRDRSPSELTLGLEGIAIVPASDRRVVEIKEWSEAARGFLNSFHDGNRKPITPAALIVRNDWWLDMRGYIEPVISFRNAVAVAAILPFRAHWQSDGWSGVSWSEAFDYHPARLRPDGSKFDLWTPALNSIGFRLDELCLTPDLRVPPTEVGHTDDQLWPSVLAACGTCGTGEARRSERRRGSFGRWKRPLRRSDSGSGATRP